LGAYHGCPVYADYAHHPEEIKANLKLARKLTKGRLYVVFQPHTYSRTRTFFHRFVQVLSSQKHLLIYRTFAAREYYDDAGSALTLSRAIKKARYTESVQGLKDFLAEVEPTDLILVLGAGDIYSLVKSFLKSNPDETNSGQ
jgi:UDP-N-acetylmuramate--alanine ligase